MNNSGKSVFENVLARLTGGISGSLGVTSASVDIDQQGAFDKFHKANYDPVNLANNEFQLSIISATQVQVTNVGTGLAVDTIDFSSGSPFAYQGLQFNIEGGVGDTVNFELDPPEKKNIAETLNDFFLALSDPNIPASNYDDAISDALVGIDNGLIALGNSISTIGGRLNVAESVFESNLDLEIANKTARSSIEEVDYAEAVSELSKQEAALSAAQATFSRVTGVSLFDFI
jgi:flagellar hook-associated protein 3 FlgL